MYNYQNHFTICSPCLQQSLHHMHTMFTTITSPYVHHVCSSCTLHHLLNMICSPCMFTIITSLYIHDICLYVYHNNLHMFTIIRITSPYAHHVYNNHFTLCSPHVYHNRFTIYSPFMFIMITLLYVNHDLFHHLFFVITSPYIHHVYLSKSLHDMLTIFKTITLPCVRHVYLP